MFVAVVDEGDEPDEREEEEPHVVHASGVVLEFLRGLSFGFLLFFLFTLLSFSLSLSLFGSLFPFHGLQLRLGGACRRRSALTRPWGTLLMQKVIVQRLRR